MLAALLIGGRVCGVVRDTTAFSFPIIYLLTMENLGGSTLAFHPLNFLSFFVQSEVLDFEIC